MMRQFTSTAFVFALLVVGGLANDCSSLFTSGFSIPTSCWVGTSGADCASGACPLQITYAPPSYSVKNYDTCSGASEAIPCYNQRITCGVAPCALTGTCDPVNLFTYLPGTSVDPSGVGTFLLAGMIQPVAAANQMMACILEYPDWNFTTTGLAGIPADVRPPGTTGAGPEAPATGSINPEGMFVWKAHQLFGGYEGEYGDTDTALDIICALSFVNCDSGVALAGNSQGASIGVTAPNYDARITATMLMAADPIEAWPPVYPGTSFTPTFDPTWNALPSTKRAYLSGAQDTDWYTFYCHTLLGNTIEQCEQQLPQSPTLYQINGNNYASSYYCGSQGYDCVQEDGSGYYVIPDRTHYQVFDYYLSGFTTQYSRPAIQWVIDCTQGDCSDWTTSFPEISPSPTPTPFVIIPPSSSSITSLSITLLVLSLFLIFGF